MPTKTMIQTKCQPPPLGQVQLLPGLFQQRFALNRNYVASLQPDNLLQNFHLEAGLGYGQLRNTTHGTPSHGDERHWGWESPTCQVRGHFLGHWLSAAARISAATGDGELQLRATHVARELQRCQERNGGEWAAPIPEKYLHWLAKGQSTWAPQYVLHKVLMGLHDMHVYGGSAMALDVADRFGDWFHRWTRDFSRRHMDDILDVETGGMLEAWADLYGATGAKKYADLIERYTRSRLFDPLLDGRDVLTNMHANTTIPEAHGAARCYEVTGDERWRRIVEAYWRWAVTERGTFCTGSQTTGEIWTPPFEFAARRGDKNQEHCVVYNMIRLADYLYRWTGDAQYLDYIERNLYNGVLAQQHPGTGQIAYFLPLEAGARKVWGSPTYDFWCCHGSLVQAHTLYHSLTYTLTADGITVAQYIPSELKAEAGGTPVTVRLTDDSVPGAADANAARAGYRHRPDFWQVALAVTCAKPAEFALRLRLPAWLAGPARLWINDKPVAQADAQREPGFLVLRRRWDKDLLRLELPKRVSVSPIPDEPRTVAFMDGPVVLAGLCGTESTLTWEGRGGPESLLVPDNERQWGTWLRAWRTRGQAQSVRFKPLFEVTDEPYTVYFPTRRRTRG